MRETAAALRGAGPLRLLPADPSRGRTASVVQVVPTAALTRLHAGLMDRLEPFERGPGDEAAFVADAREPVRRADVEWVRQIRTQAAHGRFKPHVTVGRRRAPRDSIRCPPPMPRARRSASSGRFCTCRRVLAEWNLTDHGT